MAASNTDSSYTPGNPTAASRAERLLDAMYRVFSHDLPNQLVVVQSLLSLLQDDETNLSAEGKEQVQRLRQAAGRASNMVHFLKDMARLARLSETIEDIRLSALAREVQAEVQQAYPGRELKYETSWQIPHVVVGRRSLHQALVQLLRAGIEHFASRSVLIQLASTLNESALEILVVVQPGDGPNLPGSSSSGHDRTQPDQRLEFILARELVALWDGTLTTVPQSGRTFSFAISIPSRAKNG